MDLTTIENTDLLNCDVKRGSLDFLIFDIQKALLKSFNDENHKLDLTFGECFLGSETWETYNNQEKEIVLYPDDRLNFSFISIPNDLIKFVNTREIEFDFTIYLLLGRGFFENEKRLNLSKVRELVYQKLSVFFNDCEVSINKNEILSEMKINEKEIKKYKNIDLLKINFKKIY